jgi:transposase
MIIMTYSMLFFTRLQRVCPLRELPHDFSEWHTVYRYYDMWRDKPDPTV